MTGQNTFYNLAERIGDGFSEIDSDICTELLESNTEYAEMRRESAKLKEAYPVIPEVTEGSGSISLTAGEHRALVRYLGLRLDMDDAERKQIYFRGHTDSFSYLKKIGAV